MNKRTIRQATNNYCASVMFLKFWVYRHGILLETHIDEEYFKDSFSNSEI